MITDIVITMKPIKKNRGKTWEIIFSNKKINANKGI